MTEVSAQLGPPVWGQVSTTSLAYSWCFSRHCGSDSVRKA